MSSFLNLPSELALEIIRFAASSQPTHSEQISRTYYYTALSLSRVCHAVRLATMPFLLHTVVLRSSSDVALFVAAVRLQKRHWVNRSRLAVDYQRLVRRLWSTECREPVVNDQPANAIDCRILWEITLGAETLGLHFSSAHLLSSNLAEFSGTIIPPNRQVVFAGSNRRWNPLIYTSEGLAFFKQISHLLIWDTEQQSPSSTGDRIPKWVMDVPFNHLPNLTHFAFPLVQVDSDMDEKKSIDMAACIITDDHHGGIAVRDWLTSNQSGKFASISFQDPQTCVENAQWETLFLEGKDKYIWLQAEKILSATGESQWPNNKTHACN
ncbi:hypothetical protein BDQ17DRAFT_1537335 [Cyathus striatus]|nr:hypothetical protein BDQ17DRAFT_1537335 [Cyathus striatus]